MRQHLILRYLTVSNIRAEIIDVFAVSFVLWFLIQHLFYPTTFAKSSHFRVSKTPNYILKAMSDKQIGLGNVLTFFSWWLIDLRAICLQSQMFS